MAQSKVRVGDIHDVSGEVTIAGGDIYKGFTAEQVSVLLTQIASTFQVKKFDGRCPYKGLDVFEEEDAELFFGREKLVDELVGRVKDSRTVFITGPSGSGKSSLVRAGLLPTLKQGAIKNSHRWLYETIKPGRDPLEALASAFSRLKSPELGKYFRENFDQPDTLHECAESALSGWKDQRLVLFIDQFEEVFTQVGKDKAEPFLNLLTQTAAVENGRVIILFAMRSDFVSNCATYPKLNELLNRQFIQIGAMQPDELVSAIARPALRVGLRIDPDLIAQIINDMQGEPGALPLMQFALKDLFDSQEKKGGVIALTLADYLQHGGIHKVLELHADSAFSELSKDEQELARTIFSGLIEIGRGTQDTRRTALFTELIPANRKADEVVSTVQKLADARLVTTDEQAGVDTITISHEKLIDAWPWLKKLINENRDVIALQNEIASDAKEWEEHQRDPSYLYTGARLINAREQMERRILSLSGLAQEFVQKGITRQRRRQVTLWSGVSAVVLLLAVAVIIFNNQANTNADLAKINEEVANTAKAASTLAIEQQIAAEANANEALARQFAAQAQSIYTSRGQNWKQEVAVLLAIRSMQLFPTNDSAQILQTNTLARPIARMNHDDFVTSVAFDPDGKYIVSGSLDGTARIWDTNTGAEVARLPHGGSVYSVAFSPDGKFVASGSWQGTRVWETATGAKIARMTDDGLVYSVAFSPNGKSVASGSADGIARVWEAATGMEVAHMIHDDRITSVTFSPNGKYVASGSVDGTARVWEAVTGTEIARMTYGSSVTSVVFSPDGNYVVSGSEDGTARVWETATGTEVARMTHDSSVDSVAFSPYGNYVVSGSWDGTARVWETATGTEVVRMTHDGLVFSVAFSPDGKYVVSGSIDGTALVWETATGTEVARMTHDDYVSSIAFSPDGKYVVSGSWKVARVWKVATGTEVAHMIHDHHVTSIAFRSDGNYVVSGSADKTARVWETATGNEVARMTHDDYVSSIAFSPEGKYVVSGSWDKTVRVWEADTGVEVARMTHDDWVSSVAFSPKENYVVSGSWDKTVRVWEADTGVELARMTHDDWVTSVSFSPDGNYVISGSDDGTARVWEVDTGKEIARMVHYDDVKSVAFSPGGQYVVSCGCDKRDEGNNSCSIGSARVWDAATGKEVVRITHDGLVISVAFSPNGKYVVSGSLDGTARVWEAATGMEVARKTYDADLTSVAFSPDGNYVASGSEDGIAHVWEASTGMEMARLIHDDRITSVAFSPDGKYVVSGSDSGYCRAYIYRPNDLIVNACSNVARNLTHAEWKQYIGDALPYQAICENLPIEPEATITP